MRTLRMTLARARVGVLAGALVLLATFPAMAAPAGQAPAPRPGRSGSGPQGDAAPPAELVAMLDTFAIVQAQKALDLDDEQYGRFVPLIKRLQETRRRSQRDRNQIIQELRRLTGPQAPAPLDEAAVRDKLRQLREADVQAAENLRQAYDALDQVLDVRQQARFRVFEETIERRKLDLIVRARQRAGRGGEGR